MTKRVMVKKEYPCIERTLNIPVDTNIKDDTLIRLWMNEDYVSGDYMESKAIIAAVQTFWKETEQYRGGGNRIQFFIKWIQNTFPKTNAVEIKQNLPGAQEGVVVYLVDFADDVHG